MQAGSLRYNIDRPGVSPGAVIFLAPARGRSIVATHPDSSKAAVRTTGE